MIAAGSFNLSSAFSVSMAYLFAVTVATGDTLSPSCMSLIMS